VAEHEDRIEPAKQPQLDGYARRHETKRWLSERGSVEGLQQGRPLDFAHPHGVTGALDQRQQ
jgi:hypothetical protein